MDTYNEKLKKLAVELHKIKAIKFGEFKTKVGLMTPVYCDLRVIVSFPKVMEMLVNLLIEYSENLNAYDMICGVPYTALPIAAVMSVKTGTPMVMRRKEAKDHGTKQKIEGSYKLGDKCLIVEDVVTSGSSILETVNDLKSAGLKCNDAIVLLNREQGGDLILKEHGITMHALMTMTQLMELLKETDCIDDDTVKKVADYIGNTKVDIDVFKKNENLIRLKLSFEARIKLTTNHLTKKLFEIIVDKQTTLCVAADMTDVTSLLNLAEQVGPHICILKTHIDILEDFHPHCIKSLQDIAKRHNFMLFEDRKYSDIGKTVELQCSKGIYNVLSWAQLVTAHSLTGKGVLDAVKKCRGNDARGVFLLAETSAAGNLITSEYTKTTIKMALEYTDLVVGVVCQSPQFLDKPDLIQLTPGVQLGSSGDDLGQQYNSPESVVLERGADIAVVGRGVTQSPDPAVAAENYKKLLWEAYVKRIE